MTSIVATTYELVDMEQAARELAEGIRGAGTLQANSIGLLFCDSELEEHETMLRALQALLGIDIVGCTTVAVLDNEGGFDEMCSRLMVLTADDCRFAPHLSGPVTKDNVGETIKQAYGECAARLGEQPGLIFAFPAYNLDIMLDIYPQVLSELSGHAPVFGGLPSSNDPYGKNAVLMGGKLYTDRLVLVMVGGNVRPLFSSGVELSHVADENRTITSAEANVIHTVDDMTFTQYLEGVGLSSEKLAADTTNTLFVANPLLLRVKGDDGREHQIVRSLHTVDMDKGYGVAIGMTQQGAKIAIGSLTAKDITEASTKTVNNLLAQINEREAADAGYRYTTLLAVSCIGRFMIMTPNTDLEGKVLKEVLPERINIAGFYGYGEVGPTSVKDGVAFNAAQNESLILCAF